MRLDSCEGPEIARIAVQPALASDAVTTLASEPPQARVRGTHDLCLRFAQPRLDPLWVIDRFTVMQLYDRIGEGR